MAVSCLSPVSTQTLISAFNKAAIVSGTFIKTKINSQNTIFILFTVAIFYKNNNNILILKVFINNLFHGNKQIGPTQKNIFS